MDCAQRGSANRFSILDSPCLLPSDELYQLVPQRRVARAIPQNPTHNKVQRSVDNCNPQQPQVPAHRQNGCTRPGFAGTPNQRQSALREKTSNCCSTTVPPRFRNNPDLPTKGFCPAPSQCSGATDPYLTPTLPSSEALTMELRKQLRLMQTRPPTSTIPSLIPQTVIYDTSSLLKQCVDPPNPPGIPVPVVPRSNQHTEPPRALVADIPPPPGLSKRVQQSPRIPEIAPRSRTPRSVGDLTNSSGEIVVRIPPTPGLPRQGGQCHRGKFGNRCHPLTGPTTNERLFNPAKESSSFALFNGPVDTWGVFSPPRSGVLPNVNLPAKNRPQPVPTSPASSVSTLTEDFSGSSSAPFGSDTTFTSVDSNKSEVVPPRPLYPSNVCRNWMFGRECHKLPCRFRHPPRTNQLGDPTTQPPPGLYTPPNLSAAIHKAVDVHDPPRPNQLGNPTTQPPPGLSAPPNLSAATHKTIDAHDRYGHPPRPNQSNGTMTRPPPGLSAPLNSSPVAIKKVVDAHEHEFSTAPRTRDPPSDLLYSTTISDHIKVRFDQGFEVKDVTTGFESRWVHIGNLAGHVTSTALNKLLSSYKVDNMTLNESLGKPTTAKVQFTSTEDAMKAVTDLNGTTFLKRTITAKLAINNSLRGGTVLTDTDVQLVWECPFRVGYAGYESLKEARLALDTLNGVLLEHLVVTAQLYEGLPCVGAYNVMFKQLPASVNEENLRKFAKSDAVMLQRPNYESLDKAVHSIRSRLEEYGTISSFDVIPPPYKDGMVKAWAHFTSPAEARAAQEDMDRRRPKPIGHTTLSCRHVVSLSHTLSAASYRRMREDIGWLRWSWQRRYGPGVSIREKCKEIADEDAPAFIRISSEQPGLLKELKYEFEQLLHGETVTFNKKPAWDDFFLTEAGCAYITQLQAQYPGVEIQIQNTRRVVSLWGPIVIRHRAGQDIVRKIVDLKAQQFWKIPLTGKLLSIFRTTEYTTLQELLGAGNCILDFGERVLVVRGNDASFRTACDAVQAAQSRHSDETRPSATVCPVCFGEAVVPVSLACGHQWCRACLTGYLTSAVENKMFPLKCLGNDATCSQYIPLGLSRKLLPAADFNAVIEAAFWVYVHSRPDEFFHCPTPDCTQVYRSAPRNSVLQCPSCLVRICPACHIKYHDDMTCEERDVAEDKLFNEWTANHDVKSCPGCKAPIERSEGCNHMTCARCQTHICWECMATFPRGEGIYDHMRNQHGGIGL